MADKKSCFNLKNFQSTFFKIFFVLVVVTVVTSLPLLYFYFKKLDNLQFCAIIDAGSTKSQIYLYQWESNSNLLFSNIISTKTLNTKIVTKKITSGLHSYAKNPEDASMYLKPLLDYAIKYVPTEKQKNTPLLVFATAGMRLLNEKQQTEILKNLKENLPKITNFLIDSNNIKIIDGKSEAEYSWIAMNYHLKNSSTVVNEKFGIIELGGSSIQIAFENVSDINEQLIENVKHFEHKNFSKTIFAKSLSNWGAERMFERYFNNLNKNYCNETQNFICKTNCLNTYFSKLITNFTKKTQYLYNGTGHFTNCIDDIKNLNENENLKENEILKLLNLSNVKFYGLQDFYYTSKKFFNFTEKYNYTKFIQSSKNYCLKTLNNYDNEIQLDKYYESRCFKLAWQKVLLHQILNLNLQNSFNYFDNENFSNITWPLGAVIFENFLKKTT